MALRGSPYTAHGPWPQYQSCPANPRALRNALDGTIAKQRHPVKKLAAKYRAGKPTATRAGGYSPA
eukprot:5614320-Lingulodinium_polyedra.AAC.1